MHRGIPCPHPILYSANSHDFAAALFTIQLVNRGLRYRAYILVTCYQRESAREKKTT